MKTLIKTASIAALLAGFIASAAYADHHKAEKAEHHKGKAAVAKEADTKKVDASEKHAQ